MCCYSPLPTNSMLKLRIGSILLVFNILDRMGGVVSRAAVFSIVMQCSSLGVAFLDDAKNGCEGD